MPAGDATAANHRRAAAGACAGGSGGRVFTALGDEVTPAVEAAYDEKVRRVRFQADGGSGAAKR